jgi:two-component system response regulator CpxR
MRLVVGDVVLVPASREAWKDDALLPLTSVEYSILELLLRAAGHVVTREELSKTAQGRELTFDDRSLDVHISSLRRKLGSQPGRLERIRTVRNVGYLYTPAGQEDHP